MRRVAVLMGAGVILWGPLLLMLVVLVPTGGDLPPAHLAVATALTFILVRVLYALFAVQIAPRAPGRFRIIPRYPWTPLLLAALGVATALAGLWEASSGGSAIAAALSIPGSLLLFFSAVHLHRRPIWGGYVTVADGLLRLQVPGGGYTVPVGQILRIYRRGRDRSYYIETPWPERNTLVLTRAARGNYWVDGAERLLEALGEGPPVEDVESLLRAIRRVR